MNEFTKSKINNIIFITIIFLILNSLSSGSVSQEVIAFDSGSSLNLSNCSRIIWYPDFSTGCSLPPSLRSGPIRNSGLSCVGKNVIGPADVNFCWKVDPGKNQIGELSFRVDNETILICASSDWSSASYAVSPGKHWLSWEYRKQYSYPEFSGSGWIDDLKIGSALEPRPSSEVKSTNLTSDDSIWTFKQDLSQFEDSLLSIETNVTGLNRNITRINTTIEDFKGRIGDTNLSAIEKNVLYLAGNITGINTTIEDFKGRIGDTNEFYNKSTNLSWIRDHVLYITDKNSNITEIINKNQDKIIILEDGIYHTGGLRITADNVDIRSLRKWGAMLDADGTGDGIFLNDVSNITIDSIAIVNCTEGIHIENSRNCLFTNNLISGFDNIGIKLWNSTHCTLMMNTLMPHNNTGVIGVKLNISHNNILMFNNANLSPSDKSSYLYQIFDSTGNCIFVSENGRIWDNGFDNKTDQKLDFYCEVLDCESSCWLFDNDNDPTNDLRLNLSNISNNIWNFGY